MLFLVKVAEVVIDAHVEAGMHQLYRGPRSVLSKYIHSLIERIPVYVASNRRFAVVPINAHLAQIQQRANLEWPGR